MPEISGLGPQAHSSPVAFSAAGDRYPRDADADMNELSANTTVVDGQVDLKDAEKGSPPSRPPHTVKDGGLTAWGTVFGA
jgi:hypothetical protein